MGTSRHTFQVHWRCTVTPAKTCPKSLHLKRTVPQTPAPGCVQTNALSLFLTCSLSCAWFYIFVSNCPITLKGKAHFSFLVNKHDDLGKKYRASDRKNLKNILENFLIFQMENWGPQRLSDLLVWEEVIVFFYKEIKFPKGFGHLTWHKRMLLSGYYLRI